MGIAVTVVCSVAAYTYPVTQYSATTGALTTYTGIVNGGFCGFSLTGAKSGEFEALFNTTTGLPVIEGINCTVPVNTTACLTPFITFSGAAYAYETIEVEEFYSGNLTGPNDATSNFTYIALPPVPSQTPLPRYNITTSPLFLSLTTSYYSSEYSYPLIGCVVSAGVPPYAGALAPATLSTNPAQNSIPVGAYAVYATSVRQNSSISLPLTALYVRPSTAYNFHWVCYNSVGRSPDTLLVNANTSSAVPVPQFLSSTAPSFVTAISSTAPVVTSTAGATSLPVFTSTGATSLPVFTSSTAASPPRTSGATATVSSVLIGLTATATMALAMLWA